MLGLAIEIEADDGLRTEFLLLGDEQRRLNLIVDRFLVGPERARRRQALRRRHLLPESRGGQGLGHRRLFFHNSSIANCARSVSGNGDFELT